nr:HrpW-specific chaperone [uncultured Pseudomonas sp.]
MSDHFNRASTWSELLQGDGYLTPTQRIAFERAIGMVTRCLDDALGIPIEAQYGEFHFESSVDGLEPRFLRNSATDELSSDAALTAYWVIRHIADGLLKGRGWLH